MILSCYAWLLLGIICGTQGVDWNGNNWAFACDFVGNDLSNVGSTGEECGGRCAATSGCTHFAWTGFNGGTCWLKGGKVSRADAIDLGDRSNVCGIVGIGIDWNGNNWALGCDFVSMDLSNAQSRGEECGGKCAATAGCTHFTWTGFNGGTCWMKQGPVSKTDAVSTPDKSTVCGIIDSGPGPIPGGGVGPVLNNVLATRHVNGGGDACALPRTNYANNFPFALGDIAALAHLKFKPELCGHVLVIDCGRGQLEIVVANSNYGGGMDLYSKATWPTATGNQPPGEARCSAQLTTKNAISGGSNRCFYKPGTGTSNPFYRNVGLLNTNEKIVTGATVGGRPGAHRGDNPYYAFDLGRPIDPNEEVVFTFNDGSSFPVRFSDCIDVGAEQSWT